MGTMRYTNILPNAPAADLPAGRFCLGTLSTVPFVSITTDGDEHLVTWGDVVDVQKGCKASLKNASAHAGDIYLNTCAVGAPSRPPTQLSVPASFEVLAVGPDDYYISRWIDVRGVRRAFLGLNRLNAGNITFVTQHQAFRGVGYGAGTLAADVDGLVICEQPAEEFLNHIPLGIGAGLYLNDTGGESVPDSRPHVLLDQVRVAAPKLLVDPLGWLLAGKQIDAFISLEYL